MIQFRAARCRSRVSQDAADAAAAGRGRRAVGAPQSYKNVQVLADVTPAEFMRLQDAITQWVAPKQGCAFCHAGNDYASDAKPQKSAARVMLHMSGTSTPTGANHVAPAGVTCYTCHRGQPIPAETWFPQQPQPDRAVRRQAGGLERGRRHGAQVLPRHRLGRNTPLGDDADLGAVHHRAAEPHGRRRRSWSSASMR